MRRGWKILLGILVVLGLLAGGVALGLEPFVRAKATEAAQARGVEVEIGGVRVGWKQIWLEDVRARLPEAPAITADIRFLEVRLGDDFKPSAVRVHGAEVIVRGTPTEVERQLRAWRAARGPAGAGGGSGVALGAVGIHLVWHEAAQGLQPQHVWGLRYERNEQEEMVGADLARLHVGHDELEARGLEVVLTQAARGRQVHRIETDALVLRIDLEGELLERLGELARARRGAAVVPAATRKPAPPVEADTAPAADATEAAGQRKRERGPRLRRRLRQLAQSGRMMLPASGKLTLRGFQTVARKRDQSLSLGPGTLELERTESGLKVEMLPGSGAHPSTPLSLAAELPLEGPVTARVRGGPVKLGWLGVRDGDFGLQDVARGQVKADTTLSLSAGGERLSFDGKVELQELSVQHKWLAKDTLRKLNLVLAGKGSFALDGSQLQLVEGELGVGRVRVTASGELFREGEHFRVTGAARLPLAACQDLIDSAPEGLLPLLAGVRLTGTLAAQGKLDLDTRKPKQMQVDFTLSNECRVAATPANISPRKFKGMFTRQVVGAGGTLVPHTTGPGSPNWVSRHGISQHMETAVLICEDGRFFRHQGFDYEAIENSIKENVKQRRFVRGASTISMQLAKNLYLAREKTLSRKLQEAVLTMVLEQGLSKHEMMELYLNVIEYAPGVYGIGPAARHYFNTTAGNLSLGQALYIGSILSNPKNQHFGAGGQVTAGWSSYLRRLMRLGARIKLISEEDLEEGLREQVTFKVPYSPMLPPEDEESDEPNLLDPLDGPKLRPSPWRDARDDFGAKDGAVLPP